MRKNIGSESWPELARLCQQAEPCVIDLRHTERVYPPGAVGLVLLARYRADLGHRTLFLPPVSDGLRAYLRRIDFFDNLEGLVDIEDDLSDTAHHRRNRSDRFTEILNVQEGIDDALQVIWAFLKREVSSDQLQSTYSAFDELLTNIDMHASLGQRTKTFACVQTQVYSNRIEMAFGDLGVGFLATLRANPLHRHLDSDEEALRGALENGISRFHDEAHGDGLRRVALRTEALQGQLIVASKHGLARWLRGTRSYESMSSPHPGTMTWIRIPVDRT